MGYLKALSKGFELDFNLLFYLVARAVLQLVEV